MSLLYLRLTDVPGRLDAGEDLSEQRTDLVLTQFMIDWQWLDACGVQYFLKGVHF